MQSEARVMEPVSFSERQRFASNPIAAVLGVGAALGCGAALFTGWKSSNPLEALLIVGVLACVCGFLFFGELRVEVRDTALWVRLLPLTRQHRFAWETIRRCEARTYRPILEYGGWGVRWSRRGKAYNVYGNRGVQLEFEDGQRLLIGSQQAEALAAAIRMHCSP